MKSAPTVGSSCCRRSPVTDAVCKKNLENCPAISPTRYEKGCRLLKKIQRYKARENRRAETYVEYVAARRLSATKYMCLFEQPAKRASRRSSGASSGTAAES